MQLRRVNIDGYKALDAIDVSMPMKAVFFLGVNGAGKSSILQALSFIRYFAAGRTNDFFSDRGWLPGDTRPRIQLRSLRAADRAVRYLAPKSLRISLLLSDGDVDISWSFTWSYILGQPTSESVWVRTLKDQPPRNILKYNRPTRAHSAEPSDSFRLEDLKLGGSVMSALSEQRLGQGEDSKHLTSVLDWADGITSLELLSPMAMRRGFRGKPKDIGPRGERLSGFIASLSGAQREVLVSRVAQFYPLASLETVKKTAGWIDMRMLERYPNMARISPVHMSDGFMRILALCAIPDFDEHVSIVLLDEVEDGIEPHILPALIHFLSENSTCQLIMTSHSPLLVNFFKPEQICFLTRREDGRTAVARADEMEMFLAGRDYFGVGEIWANASVDTVSAAVTETSEQQVDIASSRRSDVERTADFMEGR